MLNAFQNFVSNYAHAMHVTYQDAKRYLSPADKIILGLATGAISAITLGLATKPAYTYLVGKLKKGSADYAKHESFLKERLNAAHLEVAVKIENSVQKHESKKTPSNTLYIEATEENTASIIKGLEDTKNRTPPITKIEIIGGTHLTNNVLKHLPDGLTSLTLTGCDHITDKGIALLKKQTKLKTLNLAGLDLLTDKSLEFIGELKALKELDLGGCTRFTDNGLQKLNTLKLKKLDLCDCKNITRTGVDFLKGSKSSLLSLNIKRTAVQNLDLDWSEEFANIQQLFLEGEFSNLDLHGMEKLTCLDVSFCTLPKEHKELEIILPEKGALVEKFIIDNQGQDRLSSDTKNSIRHLSKSTRSGDLIVFSEPPKITEKPPVNKAPFTIEELQQKETLEFEEFIEELHQSPVNSIVKDGKNEHVLGEIKGSSTVPQKELLPQVLQSFDLGSKTLKLPENITDHDLKFLVRFKDLEELDLTGCKNITEEGLDYLKKLSNLQILNLSNCQFTDDASWLSVSGIKSLKTLTLDKTNISNLGLLIISGLPNLETLSLKSTPLFSSEFDVAEDFPKSRFEKLKHLDLSETELSQDSLILIQESLPEDTQVVKLNTPQPLSLQQEITEGVQDVIKDVWVATEEITQVIQGKAQDLRKIGESIFQDVGEFVDGLVRPSSPIQTLDRSKYDLTSGVLTLKSNITDEDMQYFRNAPKEQMQTIKSVIFEKNENITDTGLSELKHLPALENIELRESDSVKGPFLMHINDWAKLSLTLSKCPNFIPDILSFKTPPLKQVSVTNCEKFLSINPEELKKLNVSVENVSIELDPSKYNLTDKGILTLKSNITDEDMQLFQTMPKAILEKINSILFEENPQITDTGLSELKHFAALKTIGLVKSVLVNGSFLDNVGRREKLSLILFDCPNFDPRMLFKTPLLNQVVVEKCRTFSRLNENSRNQLKRLHINIKD